MHKPKSVLIVEDDPTSLETMACYFEVEGYRVIRAVDSIEMERAMNSSMIDLIILDIRLPGRDGLTLLRELRGTSKIPVIIVSARTEDVDHIVALEMGADDYLDKPVNLRELLVRARNVLQRAGDRAHSTEASPEVFQFAGFTLDTATRRLTDAEGENVHLTRAEYELLDALTSQARRVLQRDQLLDRLSSSRGWSPFDRSIDVLIGRLRAKIEENTRDPKLIVTVRSVGYVFLGHIVPLATAP